MSFSPNKAKRASHMTVTDKAIVRTNERTQRETAWLLSSSREG